MPYTNTGPAIRNILAPTPKIKPSFLNSIAGETIEFAKPVIGTKLPAPAKAANLSYIPIPVRNAPRNTMIIETQAATSSFGSPILVK